MKTYCFFYGLLFVVSLFFFTGCKHAEHRDVQYNFEENFFKGKQLGAEGKSDSAIYFLREALRCEGPVDSVLRVMLELGDHYRLQSNFIAAERMIQRFDSVFHADKIRDSSLVAEKYHLKGKILTSRGSYEEALGHFNNSITIKNRLYGTHQPAHAKTYNYMGIVFLYQNLYRSALNYFDSSLMICMAHEVFGKDASDSYMNKGIVYSILGQYEEAIKSFNLSRDIQELNPSVYKDLGEFYINYGNFLRSVGESNQSIDMYKKAEDLLKQNLTSKNFSISHLYINIGNAYYQRGDYDKARVYYSNTIRELENKVVENHPSLVIVRNNLAFMHFIMGEYEAAQERFSESLELDLNAETRVFLLRNLAKTIEALGDKLESENLFRQAVKESQEKLGKNHQETSVSYQALGEYNLRHKKYDEAIAMFQLALEILVNNYSIQKSTINYVKVLMAKALTLKSNFSEAEKIFLEATSGFEPGNAQSFMEADVRIKEAFFGLAGLYYLLSKGKEDTLLLEKSLNNYLTGLMIVEKLGMNIADESRLIMNQDHRRRMSEALAVCYELFVATGNTDYIDQAFELSSKAKAAVLLSSIRHNKALEFGGVPSEVTYRENALREEISVVRKLMYTERLRKIPSEAQLGYLENKLFLLDKQYDSLIEHIGHQYPAYFRLKYQNNLMQVSEVQQELNEDQVLLDYVFHDSSSFLIAATRHEKRFIKLIESQNAGTMVKELLEHLKPDFSTLSRADYDRYIDLSHDLYRHLVWPVEDMIQGKQLVVIPDGVLGYIPFEVLLTKLPDSTDRMDYAMLPYLVKSNSLSYVYSATLRYLDKEVTETSEKGKVLSFVPDYSVPHDFFAEADLEGNNRGLQLVPLPYARAESSHVLSMVEGRELLGAKASKANFISIANDYEVLHLAMHAQINDNNPLYSRLIFHPASDSLDAFTLSTYELYNLRLNANLVVLSACNTGSGSLQQGEGIMSLSRGFIYSGVPSIVMTTWEVHDESGSRLMESFYYYLREGLGKDEAMRQAKLDFLAESNRLKAHPYFWSSYVLIGNPEPILLEPSGSFWLRTALFILALVFFVSVSAYYLLKKRRLPAPDGSRHNE